MSTVLQHRRNTEANILTKTGAMGEIAFGTDTGDLYPQDGSTIGGFGGILARAKAYADALQELTSIGVQDRAALKALDTSIGSAYLLEADREGMFKWVVGDYSSWVTMDTAEGVYIPSDSNPSGSAGVWLRCERFPLKATWFGVKADNSTDCTAALQVAVNLAQTLYRVIELPAGAMKTSSALSATKGITLIGSGVQGDRGGGYRGTGVYSVAGSTGSVFSPGDHNFINALTDDALLFKDFQVSYVSQPSSGTFAFNVQSISAADSANTQTTFQGVMTTGADIALNLVNCLEFRVTNCHLMYNWAGGVNISTPHFPSYNQAEISGTEIWGNGVASNLFHIQLANGGGGDMRIVNNKLQAGGPSCNAIAFFGADSGEANIEPIIVSGNSIEGPNIGILWNTGNALQSSTQIAVTGNQFWCGLHAIKINNGPGGSPWVIGITIASNFLYINAGSAGPIVSFDGVRSLNASSNTLMIGSGSCVGWDIGPNCDKASIKITSNTYGAGVSKPTVSTPTVPASGAAVTNLTCVTVEVQVFQGTGTDIRVNSSQVTVLASGAFSHSVMLNPGDTISITYTGAPYWTWRGINP